MKIKKFEHFSNSLLLQEKIKAEQAHNPVDSLMTLLPKSYVDDIRTAESMGMDYDLMVYEAGEKVIKNFEETKNTPFGLRKICYQTHDEVKGSKRAVEILQLLLKIGFKKMIINGVNDSFIMHHPTAESQAKELRKIAEKYRGYLSVEATYDESKKIGELLEYEDSDIEDYLKKNYPAEFFYRKKTST